MIKTTRFETPEELILQTQHLLETTLSTAGTLMLSGGSTPYAIYNRIAATPCSMHPNRKLFLSDERLVPMDSPSNNAFNLTPMLEALNCEEQFIRVNTECPIEEATIRFAEELQSETPIDLGFLGMGDDGHTAGFFTPEQANLKSGPLTLYTDRPDGLQGISVTPVFLKRVERIILLVTGESKREIIHTLLNQPETIAAGIALSDHPNVELWTDIAVS